MKTLPHLCKRFSLVLVLLITAMFFAQQICAQSQTFSTPGTFSGVNGFTAPVGVTSITVEVWAGGGAGGGGNTVAAAGGGGGGYRKVTSVTVVPGTSYTITVGAGGIGTTAAGPAGGASSGTFGATTVSANGGGGGAGGNTPVGAGGTGGNNGGAGAAGVNLGHGGGGGGSAGTTSNGNSASGATGGTAVAGGGAGANGPTSGNGASGGSPGGGGSGGINFGSVSGGSGGNGKVVITWVPCTPPAAPLVSSPVNYCLNSTAIPLTATGAGLLWYTTPSGGTGSSTAPTPLTTTAGTTSYYVSQTVGCEGPRAQINVVVNALPVSSVTGQTNITCFSANDGTITVSASGGTIPYTFSVDNGINFLAPTGTNLRLFSGLLPNNPYRIKVKDNNQCISK